MGLFCRKSTVLLLLLWVLGLFLNAGSLELSAKEANDTLFEILAELPAFIEAKYSKSYPGAFKICAPKNRIEMEFIKYPGIPGVDFPAYEDIPVTSFTCSDKPRIPGMYADQETRCQVFHTCQTTEIESMLCPIGTTFNQAIRACDYWYNSNCSMAPHYYTNPTSYPYFSHLKTMFREMLGPFLDFKSKPQFNGSYPDLPPWRPAAERLVSFLPVKFKTTVYSEAESTPIEKTVNWLEKIGQETRQALTAEHEPVNEDESLLDQDDFYTNPYWDEFDPEVLCQSKQYADLAHFIITHGLSDFVLESLRMKLRLDLDVKDVDPTAYIKLMGKSVKVPTVHEKATGGQIKRMNLMQPETEAVSAETPPRSPNRRRVVVPETEQTQKHTKPKRQPDDSVSNTLFQNCMKLVEEIL